MALTIGNGTITGLNAGGLPDACVRGENFALNSLTVNPGNTAPIANTVMNYSLNSSGGRYYLWLRFPGGFQLNFSRFQNQGVTTAAINSSVPNWINFTTGALSAFASQTAAADTGGVTSSAVISTLPSTTGWVVSTQSMTTSPSFGHAMTMGR